MMPLSTDMLRTTLVLGGARSGKSRYAEELLAAAQGACVYIATAEARDAEMAARIAEHQARRGDNWQTVEQPLDLVAALQAHSGANSAVLVDCLTLWLSNLMAASRDIAEETRQLVRTLSGLEGHAVLVSNEVGQGIVPENAVAREFRDHAGRLNQAVAAAVDEVVLITAGLPQRLKP
ncbi:MAG: Bifunctional adenosylcobalamin biosynthesis protein CobP [Alphaproteobacteria bacterium MarineAlpha10_Bin1]|jgi:adenosylcobinamide kinase/adenosylcobinamide-phosphate guanylyltransferase|nr:MAG: Bifunctional adenosylcobalamin biosynthesis protein CobP [Alphaproteobacteria bacterium MarineAlpha10_Bin1]